MPVSSTDIADSQALHIYRLPVHQKDKRNYYDDTSIPYVRSPSSDSQMIVSQQRQTTPPPSTLRLVEMESSPAKAYIKRYYPPTRTARIIREPSSTSTETDVLSVASSPLPVSVLKRKPTDRQVVRLAINSASTSSNTDVIVPITTKNRRPLTDTSVAIVSKTSLVNRGTSPKRLWKKQDRNIPIDEERNVYVSDEDYYEEAFHNGVSCNSRQQTYLKFFFL